MNTHNQNALFKLTYGLYVLTAREGDKDNGCIINVASQLTDTPQQMLVSVNKQNYTHDMIVRTGLFNVSLLTEHTPMKVIEHFGFQSGRDVNKFENCEVEMRASNGVLYLPRYCNAYLSGKVSQMVDLGTHTLFIASIEETSPAQDDATYTVNLENDGEPDIPSPQPWQSPPATARPAGCAKPAATCTRATRCQTTTYAPGANTAKPISSR